MSVATTKRKKPANPVKMVAVSAAHIEELEGEIRRLNKTVVNAQNGFIELKRYLEGPKYLVDPYVHKDEIINRINEILSWMSRTKYG